MRQQTILGVILFTFVCGSQSVGVSTDTVPSATLSSALTAKVAASGKEEGTVTHRAMRIRSRMQSEGIEQLPCIFVEREADRRCPSLSGEIPAGTLREQLDALCQMADYDWLADGDWVSLVPKHRLSDSNYIMNQKIPGKVVVSRVPGLSTPVKEWFAEHKLTCALNPGMRLVGGKRVLGPDTITLVDPTFRSCVNARNTIYGCYLATMTISTVGRGAEACSHIVEWRQENWKMDIGVEPQDDCKAEKQDGPTRDGKQ